MHMFIDILRFIFVFLFFSFHFLACGIKKVEMFLESQIITKLQFNIVTILFVCIFA